MLMHTCKVECLTDSNSEHVGFCLERAVFLMGAMSDLSLNEERLI